MLTHIAAYLAGAGTMFAIAVTLGARWRRKRRRVDALHAEMLAAIFDVQDAVAMGLSADTCNSLRSIRDTAAARYFAAVGEG